MSAGRAPNDSGAAPGPCLSAIVGSERARCQVSGRQVLQVAEGEVLAEAHAGPAAAGFQRDGPAHFADAPDDAADAVALENDLDLFAAFEGVLGGQLHAADGDVEAARAEIGAQAHRTAAALQPDAAPRRPTHHAATIDLRFGNRGIHGAFLRTNPSSKFAPEQIPGRSDFRSLRRLRKSDFRRAGRAGL